MKGHFTVYSLIMLAAIVVSLGIWLRVFRKDTRMISVYVGALLGAVIGAKVVYLLAEGWMAWGSPPQLQQWMTGKSVVGALLGGYGGVELGKWLSGYRAPTGDYFALIVPASIAVGRTGCWLQGCCLGKVCEPAWWAMPDAHGLARWPAVPVEIGFNVLAFCAALVLRRLRVLPGQHFHLYLMAYGIFRFFHETLRETPAIWGGVTGYQIAALLVAAVGAVGFRRRAVSVSRMVITPSTG